MTTSNLKESVRQPKDRHVSPVESKMFFQRLGPGLITGASDDDPSGIGTYSQVAARFGFGMLWVMLFSYPLMSIIQEISARIGRVTGLGIAGILVGRRLGCDRRHVDRGVRNVCDPALKLVLIFALKSDASQPELMGFGYWKFARKELQLSG